MTPTDTAAWCGYLIALGSVTLMAMAVARVWRGFAGTWWEGDCVPCPECGRRAELEHWYGPDDCSLLSTTCCAATVVAEAEPGGKLVYPYGRHLWTVSRFEVIARRR